MNVFTLTVGAGPVEDGVFTYVLAAPRAVIRCCERQQFAPAVPAKFPVGFADAFSAVRTDSRPEQMIYPVQYEAGEFFHRVI